MSSKASGVHTEGGEGFPPYLKITHRSCPIGTDNVNPARLLVDETTYEVLNGFIIRYVPWRASAYLGNLVSDRPKSSYLDFTTDVG